MSIEIELLSPAPVRASSPALVRHGATAYDITSDELVVDIGASVLRIRPGRELAESLTVLMVRVAEKGEIARLEGTMDCPACGALVRDCKIGPKGSVLLDAEPDETSVYVITRPGRARSLRPFEQPVGGTYRKHRC